MSASLLEQARQLSLDEQLELVEALWDTIADQAGMLPITLAQAAELDRRLAEHEAHPDDVVPWQEVKAAARARIAL